jgi:hypothetical protein
MIKSSFKDWLHALSEEEDFRLAKNGTFHVEGRGIICAGFTGFTGCLRG